MERLRPDRPFTLAEYLAIEPEGNVRHEFVDGELVAMTGTSRAHDTIAGNLVAAIRPRLRGTPCRVASANMKAVSADMARGSYPDVVVSCSDPSEEPEACARRLAARDGALDRVPPLARRARRRGLERRR